MKPAVAHAQFQEWRNEVQTIVHATVYIQHGMTCEGLVFQTCLLQFPHVGINKRHASHAIPPPPEQLLIVIPFYPLAYCASLKKDRAAMLQCEEPARQICQNGEVPLKGERE